MRIAVLDDWQGVARDCADWSGLEALHAVDFHRDPFGDEDAATAVLEPYDGVVTMRDRTWFPRSLLERLPRLTVIAQTGMHALHIDLEACDEFGIAVLGSEWGEFSRSGTPELCLGLILAAWHRIVDGHANLRAGRWQDDIPIGASLAGRTLGLVGLGVVGSTVARYARALELDVVAWSPHLTPERAAAGGARLVGKRELMSGSDIVSLHLVASPSTRGIIGREDLDAMPPGALLVNTARAALVDQDAMREAVLAGRISAALDVYDHEPLTGDSWLRGAPNVVLTPHLGFVKRDLFEALYSGIVTQLEQWLAGEPALLLGGRRD